MKYWVYKESRILGPFDKEGVSGLPGLDSGTLICEGDPSGGSWLPAGEIKDLGGISASSAGFEFGELPSTIGLLDQLQIDASGLVGDDDFPGSLAEDLFQDASFRKGFGDVFAEGGSSDGADAVRARQKAAELTVQLETMYKRIAELETSQAELQRRLGEKERELLQQETGIPADAGPAKTFLSPAPGPKAKAPVTPPAAPPPSGLEPAPAPSDWSETKGAGSPLPAIFDAPAPSVVVPAVPDLPAMPSFAAPAPSAPLPSTPPLGLPSDAAAPPAPEPPAQPAPKTLSFGKPKSFKIVPTVRSFKVLGAADAAPVDANPAPVFSEPAPTPAPAPVIPPPPAVAAAPAPAIPPPPPEIAPIVAPVQLAPAPVPAPIPTPAPIPEPVMPNPFAVPEKPVAATPTPFAPPPNTLSRSQPQPVPDLGATVQASANDLAGSSDAPPMTLARGRGAAEAPVDAGAAARFAKPEPAPATAAPKPPRSNKKFLIGGGILVVLLMVVGVIFMRQPKDDLKQMATLDDGKAPIGLPADDAATAPPIVKPKIAEPAPEPVAPPPPPGPSAEHQAAIAAVKDFPLDGGRGTVGRWLQYSYTASPGAGTEEWNASTTGDSMLVEYRLVPGASGGKGALYLFEVNNLGLVMGKNLEAREMLAGGPPAEPVKPKKAKAPAKKAVKRRPVVEEPKEVPLLPLPDSGELRPPAEDDGTFGSDTINSGI